mgnify:CR=1 FL=1
MEYILNEYHRNISNQELLNDIKSTAEKLNKKVLTQDEYSRYGKYSPNTVQRRFGGWNKALLLCGMCPNAYQLGAAKSKPLYQHISDEDLLSDVSAVAQRLHKDTVSCGEYEMANFPGILVLNVSEIGKILFLKRAWHHKNKNQESVFQTSF